MIAVAIVALCMWLRFEPGLEEWLTKLELTDFYIGIYVLICGGVIMVIVSFIGCFSALNEHKFLLTVVSYYFSYSHPVSSRFRK